MVDRTSGQDFTESEGWGLRQPIVRRKFQALRRLQANQEKRIKEFDKSKYPYAGRCTNCGKDVERVNPVSLRVCKPCALRINEIAGFTMVKKPAGNFQLPIMAVSRHPNVTFHKDKLKRSEPCYTCGRLQWWIYYTNTKICDRCVGAVARINCG